MSGLSIRFDKRTKFTHISFKHFSPYFAKELLDQLVLTINEDIKNTEVDAANESIKFLEDQMTKTNISDIRFIFTKLIEKNIKTILLAEVSPEYVFEILDPAFVPDLRSSPSRGVLCILITAFGFLFIAGFDHLDLFGSITCLSGPKAVLLSSLVCISHPLEGITLSVFFWVITHQVPSTHTIGANVRGRLAVL